MTEQSPIAPPNGGGHFLGAVICVALLSALSVATAFADTTGSSSQSATPGFGLLGFLIAYSTRRRPIGGWLLYFYMQLYLSLLVTLALSIPYIGYLSPGKWARTDLYIWYVFAVVPSLIAQGMEVVVATMLLSQRTEANLRRLRTSIAALLLATAASLFIELKFLDTGSDMSATVTLDGVTIFFAAIWLAYFYKSVRVRRVFIDRDWAYTELPQKAGKTPRERRHLLGRAAVSGGVLYLTGFALVGLNQAEAKPDPAMLFGIPLIYAMFAALISYVCPISKKTRDRLAAKDVPQVAPTA